MTRYRTIVADPPWPYGTISPSNPRCAKCGHNRYNHGTSRCQCPEPAWEQRTYPLPYKSMTVEHIEALPVAELAEPDAHLYLWTTQRFLWQAPAIARAWNFTPAAVLIWSKPPQGMGGTFVCSAEFVLFARRGSLKPQRKHVGTVFTWPRGRHSEKPDAFLDLVEQVSPGPYVELFARRARFGWDYWGDESLGTAELTA